VRRLGVAPVIVFHIGTITHQADGWPGHVGSPDSTRLLTQRPAGRPALRRDAAEIGL